MSTKAHRIIVMQLQHFFFGAIKLMVKHESKVSLLHLHKREIIVEINFLSITIINILLAIERS